MNTQFGQWTFSPREADRNWLDKIISRFLSDAPHPPSVFSSGTVSVVHCDLKPVRLGGPTEFPHGSVVLWDGRLDNAEDLRRALGGRLDPESSDAQIVAEAFERWNTDAFRRLLGDWSLAAWNPAEQSLVLAKDPIGSRPLFYQLSSNGLRWGTALEWMVEAAESPLQLNLEYLAGWLSFFPATNLTPYKSIESVPPSSFVRFVHGMKQVQQYWEFATTKPIQFLHQHEYDERFRELLAQSVRRRLRANGPMLAELSGGMDSSSIVCMADTFASNGELGTPRLDTLSYFDDAEPNWNERPYFTKVEEKRGRAGVRIALDFGEDLDALFRVEEFASTPAECARRSPRNQAIRELAEVHGYAGILSGIGGDEFTGGVPTAQPELADLLVAGRFFTLASRLKVWALSQRRPWTHLLVDTAAGFLPPSWSSASRSRPLATWLDGKFVGRYLHALDGYRRRLQVFGPRPSFQENLFALNMVRRQLACSHTTSRVKMDKRYPYLDRDLLEFLFAVPRHQLTQPGRRRALMRRALAGIVPDEVLARKRKAYVARAPRVAISARWDAVESLSKDMVAGQLGMVSPRSFKQALLDVRTGIDVPVQPILRTLALEKWLRTLLKHNFVTIPSPIWKAKSSGIQQTEMTSRVSAS
jgi:asparagine synthase (glutamine-hydrolysing)